MDREDFGFETFINIFRVRQHFNIQVIATGYEIRAFLTPFSKCPAVFVRPIEDLNEITATTGSARFEIYSLHNHSYLVALFGLNAPKTTHITPILFGEISAANCLPKCRCLQVQIVFTNYINKTENSMSRKYRKKVLDPVRLIGNVQVASIFVLKNQER